MVQGENDCIRPKKVWPASDTCPVCCRAFAEVGAVVYLMGGAVIDSNTTEDLGLHDQDIKGFLHIGYHGNPDVISADVKVVRDSSGGQFDLNFCSLECLRHWFLEVVQYLESEIANRKQINSDKC